MSQTTHLPMRPTVREYENFCSRWCDKHRIGRLSQAELSRCLRIPNDGLRVDHPHFAAIYFPHCGVSDSESVITQRLCNFFYENGKVLFVYRDGHTYLTQGYWAVEKLINIGFHRGLGRVPVPLSCSDGKIADPNLAEEWETACLSR